MKSILKYSVFFGLFLALFTSCSKSDDEPVVNELSGLTKIKEITNDTHIIELYNTKGALQQGYNEISLRIKNKLNGSYEKTATVTWQPIMHMSMMSHSCPFSAVQKTTANGTLYKGYVVFQMAQNDTEYWDIKLDYTIDGVAYSITSVIDVPASEHKNITTFTGTDGAKYVMAYMAPETPKVAVNDFKVGLWKMQSMMSFTVVDGYQVNIDPRMPSMGNHGSPNNVNATQIKAGDFYAGKLSLTMTGYWKINLQLLNVAGEVIKGEAITETQTDSSIYFDLEF
ncbi:MAG: hypothetical protein JST78_01765 [Bacteroidetes bacterium]|nr:hypothetical protein [Bacteroidota bacterium]